ncbi:MAG: hypothetical protein P4L27_08375 [Ignavibacteriaceae bacterium]|nr:hypothetical protein [Ignavibacteriaceae bacterium]
MNIRSGNYLLISALFLSFILFPVLLNAADNDKNKDNDEITQLKAKVDELEKTVQKQEKQISALSEKYGKLLKSYYAWPKGNDPKNLPKGSKPFKYLGQEYYMIPVNSQEGDKSTH